jgi:hypothetical protein
MSARAFVQLMVVFVAAVVIATLSGRALARLREPSEPVFVASKWKGGKLVGRAITKTPDGAPLDDLEGTLVFERVLGESWLPSFSADAMSLSMVASRDGVRVDLDGKTAYVTPDDLLARQAYDHGLTLDTIGLTMGVDMPVVVALAAERLGKNPIDVQDHARFRRIRTTRVIPGTLPERPMDESSFDDETASKWVLAAARHLARGVSSEGRFRYLINVPTNQTLGGYDWPRHAGATYFLAQAAAHAHAIHAPDATTLDRAALRAAMLLATHALSPCGTHKCIGEGDSFEIGSIALTTVAFAELVSSNLDTSFKPLVRDLAETIASLQRPDGEFMHEIHKDGSTVDVQLPYFSGEAALALTRAYAILAEPRYLEGARKSVAYLTGPAWRFFGNRYYFAEEHWTCQVVGETWPNAPDPSALDFCLRWQAFNRSVQLHKEDCVLDCDGALGVGPLVTPRFTPVASRCEAGVATLDAAVRARVDPAEVARLRSQIRRSLALLARQQFHGQLEHLMADPDAVRGGMPGSEVDWQIRIDYAQHAGSAMLRWLALPQDAKR